MTIDGRKIISNLDMSLENMKWEASQNVKWGALINETLDDIIDSVGYFTNSTRILKSKTSKDVWEGCRFKRDHSYYLESF